LIFNKIRHYSATKSRRHKGAQRKKIYNNRFRKAEFSFKKLLNIVLKIGKKITILVRLRDLVSLWQ